MNHITNVHNSPMDGDGCLIIYFSYSEASYNIRVSAAEHQESVKQQMIDEIAQNGA